MVTVFIEPAVAVIPVAPLATVVRAPAPVDGLRCDDHLGLRVNHRLQRSIIVDWLRLHQHCGAMPIDGLWLHQDRRRVGHAKLHTLASHTNRPDHLTGLYRASRRPQGDHQAGGQHPGPYAMRIAHFRLLVDYNETTALPLQPQRAARPVRWQASCDKGCQT